jgi:hypothetical protein
MDVFDYSDEELQASRSRAGAVWNILTILTLIMTTCVCVVAAAIFINPHLPINPFPPPTLPAVITFPTATPTPRVVLPPTWTPTNTEEPPATATPPQIQTPAATFPVGLTPTGTGPTGTPPAGFTFVLHEGDPVAIPNIGHPDLGCDWMGVGGRAFDLTGAPIAQGLFVQLGGTLAGEPLDFLGMVGMVSNYGPGSYEFTLADAPVASRQTLWVQIFDQALIPLSDKIFFDTYEDCERNLILLNFNQVR